VPGLAAHPADYSVRAVRRDVPLLKAVVALLAFQLLCLVVLRRLVVLVEHVLRHGALLRQLARCVPTLVPGLATRPADIGVRAVPRDMPLLETVAALLACLLELLLLLRRVVLRRLVVLVVHMLRDAVGALLRLLARYVPPLVPGLAARPADHNIRAVIREVPRLETVVARLELLQELLLLHLVVAAQVEFVSKT